MVIKLNRDGSPNPPLDRMLGKLGSLVSDIEAIRRGVSPEELAGNQPPMLASWTPRLGQKMYLEGLSTGHPKLCGQDRLISTSELFLLSEDQAWARTLSRWYRLGEPGFLPGSAVRAAET
ncbi:DUF6634 family protein [Tianweitania sediminis]|uniref:Uncharacterized protein n=1 Tax=Tianweitania sediminis TaxID=1502156 RepID=A0A8J7R0R2_9HYPH|nr:DUF6634 family protein [Tianweitania sediminis]MBP0437980.1 hypothetical protein [Tianweitania sediminis]